MKKHMVPLILAVAALAGLHAQETAPVDIGPPRIPPPAFQVGTWVTDYRVEDWKANLAATHGGAHCPGDTLTRIMAQGFRVSGDGSVRQTMADKDLAWLQDYCRSRRIDFMLTFTNYNDQLKPAADFDWRLAMSAFADHRGALVANILAWVERWQASGVSIDFEGYDTEEKRQEFAAFLKELGTALHWKGKALSVAVFPSLEWCEPNLAWVGDWLGYVDHVDNMGYDGIYGGGSEWHGYDYLAEAVRAAGYRGYQHCMGLPAWVGAWGSGGMGTGILDHLAELLSRRYTGEAVSVCIWSALMGAEEWRSAAVWDALHLMRTQTFP
jgi:hypothetical protein